jgi:hypothetical protein
MLKPNSFRRAAVPLDFDSCVDGNPASGLNVNCNLPGAAHRAIHVERFQRSGFYSMNETKDDLNPFGASIVCL